MAESVFFEGRSRSHELFARLEALIREVGEARRRITKSQIAFKRKRNFAWAWIPGRYLKGAAAPLVVSISLERKDGSPRWKEVVEPSIGRFIHHLEIRDEEDLDDQVRDWLDEAWRRAK